MTYSEFLQTLKGYAETDFADFQRKLISTKQKILGVRTPTLRKLAKANIKNANELMQYPDEYYEVTFIKLAVVAALPYPKFLEALDVCVAKIDNWATCDTFKANCIKGNQADFLPVLEKLFVRGEEFYERYVLVTLLTYYVEPQWLETIEEYLSRADTRLYYVHMAAAWLTAEVLVKYYEKGVTLLKKGVLDIKTHNKAIQKAIESYRLHEEQKEYLRSLKIKSKKTD